jgi:cell division protein ZapA
MNEYNVLKVNIYGTDYPIKGSTNVEYIKQIAEYVDSKMREVDQNIAVVSALKVAILAALNIADELFKERLKNEKLPKYDFEDKIEKWISVLDEGLNQENK